MNELMLILGILLYAAIAGTAISLMKDGYYAFIRLKNKRKYKRIEILYRAGMAESANILHLPLIRYRDKVR